MTKSIQYVLVSILALTACLKRDRPFEAGRPNISPMRIDSSAFVVSVDEHIYWYTGSDTTRHFVSYAELIHELVNYKEKSRFPNVYIHPNLEEPSATERFLNSCDSLGLKKVRLALSGVQLDKWRESYDSAAAAKEK